MKHLLTVFAVVCFTLTSFSAATLGAEPSDKKDEAASQYYAFDQVNKPGGFTLKAGEKITLNQAIARAGGFTRLAWKRRVMLKRVSEKGETQTTVIDLTDSERGDRVTIQSGDVIIVPAIE